MTSTAPALSLACRGSFEFSCCAVLSAGGPGVPSTLVKLVIALLSPGAEPRGLAHSLQIVVRKTCMGCFVSVFVGLCTFRGINHGADEFDMFTTASWRPLTLGKGRAAMRRVSDVRLAVICRRRENLANGSKDASNRKLY